MSAPISSRLRPLKKVPLGISILVGLYLFGFFVSRSVLNSLYGGIESSRATGLSAVAPSLRASYLPLPAYQSAEGLLRAGGINVVRAVSLALEAPRFEIVEPRVTEITIRRLPGRVQSPAPIQCVALA